MKLQALLSFMACGVGLFLNGCGGGNPAPAVQAVSPLAGNWLITGPLPTTGVPFGGMGSGLFSLAMSFDVNGNNVTASAYASGFCASSSSPPIFNDEFSFSTVTTGVIAADGSLTLLPPQDTPIISLSLQSKVPQSNADQFMGTYVASFDSTIGRPCVGNSSGTFTATPLPLVTGTYTGAGNLQTLTNGTSNATPITMQVNLQQGAFVLDPATGQSKSSNIAIGGTIQIQGFPCFSSGVANTTLLPISGREPASSIAGNTMLLNFTMNDGSTLGLTGSLDDLTGNSISAGLALLPTEKCPGSYVFPWFNLTRKL